MLGSIPVGKNPFGGAWDPANGDLYVANDGSNNVTVVNVSTGLGTTSIPAGNYTQGVVYDPATREVYVVNYGGQTSIYGNVTVVNPSTNRAVASIPVGLGPDGITLDPANGKLYVPNSGGNNLTVIDAASGLVVGSINVSLYPSMVTLDPTNGYLYVTQPNFNNITVVNASTNKVVGSIDVGAGPQGIAYDPATGYLYVANDYSETLSVVSPMGAPIVVDSLYVAPPSASITTGKSVPLAAHVGCTVAPCPIAVTVTWNVTNSLGTLSVSGTNATFKAGATAGVATVFANASLNGGILRSAPVVITISLVPTISGLTVLPALGQLAVGATQWMNASATCSPSPCPSGLTYRWAVNNTVGSLSSTTGASVNFTAGPSPGVAGITVTANITGSQRNATSTLTVTSSGTGAGTPSGILGLSGIDGYILVAVLLAVVIVVVVVLMRRRPRGPAPASLTQVNPPPRLRPGQRGRRRKWNTPCPDRGMPETYCKDVVPGTDR